MPRKAKVVVVERSKKREEEEDEDLQETLARLEEQEKESLDDAEKLSTFMASFGGKSYQVRVEKFNEGKKRWEAINLFDYDGFDPFKTCVEFGPGEYQFALLDDHGKYVKSGYRPRLAISEAVGKIAKEEKREEADPLKHPMVALMLQQAQESRKEMIALFQAMATRPEAPRAPATEALDMLLKLKSLEPRQDDPLKDLTKSLLPLLLERGLNPDKGDGDSPSVADQIKDALSAFTALQPHLSALKGRAAKSAPQPAQPQTSQAQLAQEDQSVNPIAQALGGYVPQFVKWAKRGYDVEAAADHLVDELEAEVIPVIIASYKPIPGVTLTPEAIWSALVDKAQKPEEVEVIFKYAPELAPHRDWVLRVVAEALKLVTTPEGDEDEALPVSPERRDEAEA